MFYDSTKYRDFTIFLENTEKKLIKGIRPVQKGGVRAFYIQQPPKINETKFARVRGCIFSTGMRLNNSLFPLNKANYLRFLDTEFEPNPDSRLAL